MSSVMHYMNNHPVSICNIYKYLANLFKIGVIPEFKVEIQNGLTECMFSFNYGEEKISIIKYYTETEIWKSYTNVISIDDINSNYNNYSYLIDNDMISVENGVIIFQSDDINDILEPSLNPFNPVIVNNNYVNPRILYDIDNNKLHNLNHTHYYMFINRLRQDDTQFMFNQYKNIVDNIPEELWMKIYSYYKPSDINYNDFINDFL